jgi:hypothetical protein
MEVAIGTPKLNFGPHASERALATIWAGVFLFIREAHLACWPGAAACAGASWAFRYSSLAALDPIQTESEIKHNP